MDAKTKIFSQIFDKGIRAGIIAQINERVLTLLVGLLPFMDNEGRCCPSEKLLSKMLGIAPCTISQRIRLAKRTIYRGEPILEVYQDKQLIKGQWEFSNNQYKISRHIREDLISRFTPVGAKSDAGKNEIKPEKTKLPEAVLPSTANTPTNDSPSFFRTSNNDNRPSPNSDRPFRGMSLVEFETRVQNQDDFRCLEIAKWVGEKCIDFILSAKNDPKCGMNGIEQAYSMTKDMSLRNKAKNKGGLFNFYIQKYKQDK